METRKGITKAFNAALFLYLFFSGFVDYFVDPEGDKRVPLDEIYDWSPLIAVLGAFMFLLVLVIWGSVLIRIFWNRFLSDVFKIRAIDYSESLAIFLIMTMLTI